MPCTWVCKAQVWKLFIRPLKFLKCGYYNEEINVYLIKFTDLNNNVSASREAVPDHCHTILLFWSWTCHSKGALFCQGLNIMISQSALVLKAISITEMTFCKVIKAKNFHLFLWKFRTFVSTFELLHCFDLKKKENVLF